MTNLCLFFFFKKKWKVPIETALFLKGKLKDSGKDQIPTFELEVGPHRSKNAQLKGAKYMFIYWGQNPEKCWIEQLAILDHSST